METDSEITWRITADRTGLPTRTVTVAAFWKSLVDLDLFSEAECRSLRDALPFKDARADAAPLAEELVRRGEITPYQAKAIYRDRARWLIIGDYRIWDQLGAGGMGKVFRARHKSSRRDVAIKILPPSLTGDPAAVHRFRREATAASKLHHRNIVAAFAADTYEEINYFVMEYVEGENLERLVRKDGVLPILLAIDCLTQAARGLSEAHQHGIIHRDVKPSNLLLDPKGVVKVLDLGLASLMDEGATPTNANAAANMTGLGSMIGTVDFMAPEQADNPHAADARADIYSLGCTLYFLLVGRAPFERDTLLRTLTAHREAAIPSLRAARSGVPAPMLSLYKKMVAKSADDRPQTMERVIEALEASRVAALSTDPDSSSGTLTSTPPPAASAPSPPAEPVAPLAVLPPIVTMAPASASLAAAPSRARAMAFAGLVALTFAGIAALLVWARR